MLPILLMIPISLVINTIEFKNGKKPKAYFQFWASQVFLLVFTLRTLTNFSNDIANFRVFIGVSSFVWALFANSFDYSTPTQCCCCFKHFFHKTVIVMSLFTSFAFGMLFIPSILLIYYLYPIQTLARLPFIINSFFYMNSLAALLLYQIEGLVYYLKRDYLRPSNKQKSNEPTFTDFRRVFVSPLKQREDVHKQFYENTSFIYMEKPLQIRPVSFFLGLIIVTTLLLALLGTYIYVCYEFLKMDINGFTSKDNTTLLATLLPLILLLFGSYYKRDFFFAKTDNKPKKSEKELLVEILERNQQIVESNQLILKELKQTNSRIKANDDQSTEDNQGTGQGQSTGGDPDRENEEQDRLATRTSTM